MTGRKAKLPLALFKYDFSQLARREPHARTRLRFLGLSHLQGGASITEVAKICKIARSTVYDWLERLQSEGVDGLREREGRGPHTKLPSDQHEAFKQSVIELQNNRDGGRIRGTDVLRLMQEEFGIECNLSTVYRTLERVDLVWISGRSVHPKANTESQEDFKKTSKKM